MLSRGQAAAYVAQKARGFTLDTPESRVIDLGTRFNVTTSADKGAYVSVGEGSVEVSPLRGGVAVADETRLVEKGRTLFVAAKSGGMAFVADASNRRETEAERKMGAESNFDSSIEGWVVSGDGSPADRRPSGIGQSGYLFSQDLRKSQAVRFVAPRAFHGDFRDLVGGQISYDLFVQVDDPNVSETQAAATRTTAEFPVIIRGAKKTLAHRLETVPKHGYWRHFSYVLSADAGSWVVVGKNSNRPASARDFADVMADVRSIEILGEYYAGVEFEECRLDNVQLVGPTP
jgi:hypothetical protein